MPTIKNIHFQLANTIILTIGLSISFDTAQAQEEIDPFKLPTTSTGVICRDVPDKNIIVIIDDSYPEYPGGIIAMRSFLSENIIYPSDSVEGKVYVSLIVDTSGRVKDVKIKRSLSSLADTEVIRVVKLMIFKPAIVDEKPVNSKISFPISFKK